jgi:hypothetical protein
MECESTQCVAALVKLLEEQRTYYRRLRILADRQRTLVMMDDAGPLLDLLAERQRAVDALAALMARMAPYRSRWTQLYRDLDDASRRQVTDLLEEVNGSIGSILQSDSQDTATLQARQQGRAEQLSTICAGQRAGAAYASAGSVAAAAFTVAEA